MNWLPSFVRNEFEALWRHMVASGQQFAADTMEVLEKWAPYMIGFFVLLGVKLGYDFFSKSNVWTENTI